MKTSSLNSATQISSGSSPAKSLRSSAALKVDLLQPREIDATEVTFVSQAAMAKTLKKGIGVMIGDYFVGVTTGSDLLFSHSAIVY